MAEPGPAAAGLVAGRLSLVEDSLAMSRAPECFRSKPSGGTVAAASGWSKGPKFKVHLQEDYYHGPFYLLATGRAQQPVDKGGLQGYVVVTPRIASYHRENTPPKVQKPGTFQGIFYPNHLHIKEISW